MEFTVPTMPGDRYRVQPDGRVELFANGQWVAADNRGNAAQQQAIQQAAQLARGRAQSPPTVGTDTTLFGPSNPPIPPPSGQSGASAAAPPPDHDAALLASIQRPGWTIIARNPAKRRVAGRDVPIPGQWVFSVQSPPGFPGGTRTDEIPVRGGQGATDTNPGTGGWVVNGPVADLRVPNPPAQPRPNAVASGPTQQFNPDGTPNPNYTPPAAPRPNPVASGPNQQFNPDGTPNPNYTPPRPGAPRPQPVPFTSRGANGETYTFRWNPEKPAIEVTWDGGNTWDAIDQTEFAGYGEQAQLELEKAKANARGVSVPAAVTTRERALNAPPSTNKPEGFREEHVRDGQVVTEISDGKGGWRIDPHVVPRPFVPEKPKEPTPPRVQFIQRNGRTIAINIDTQEEIKDWGQTGDHPSFVTDPVTGLQMTWNNETQSFDVVPGQTPKPPTFLEGQSVSQPTFTQRDPVTGALSTVENPNVIEEAPKDPAARIAHMQRLGSAYQQRLLKKVEAGTMTSAEADADFDRWWSENIDVPLEQLKADQDRKRAQDDLDLQTEERKRAKEQQDYVNDRQTAGAKAGQTAIENERALLPYRVGPTFADTAGQLVAGIANRTAVDISPQSIAQAVMFKEPGWEQIASQASAQALAHISPYAASLAGMPMPTRPSQVNLDELLGRSIYKPPSPWAAATAQPAPVADVAPPQVAPAPAPPVPQMNSFNGPVTWQTPGGPSGVDMGAGIIGQNGVTPIVNPLSQPSPWAREMPVPVPLTGQRNTGALLPRYVYRG